MGSSPVLIPNAGAAGGLRLRLHPSSPELGVKALTVACERVEERILTLCYQLSGTTDRLRIPAQKAGRADGLWAHTCFEAFIRRAGEKAYAEYNFSPSGQWAAYGFTRYRQGMFDLPEQLPPVIDCRVDPLAITLRVELHLPACSALSRNHAFTLGLSSVVEDLSGDMAYWALAHPADRPDFHHPRSFVHRVSAVTDH